MLIEQMPDDDNDKDKQGANAGVSEAERTGDGGAGSSGEELEGDTEEEGDEQDDLDTDEENAHHLPVLDLTPPSPSLLYGGMSLAEAYEAEESDQDDGRRSESSDRSLKEAVQGAKDDGVTVTARASSSQTPAPVDLSRISSTSNTPLPRTSPRTPTNASITPRESQVDGSSSLSASEATAAFPSSTPDSPRNEMDSHRTELKDTQADLSPPQLVSNYNQDTPAEDVSASKTLSPISPAQSRSSLSDGAISQSPTSRSSSSLVSDALLDELDNAISSAAQNLSHGKNNDLAMEAQTSSATDLLQQESIEDEGDDGIPEGGYLFELQKRCFPCCVSCFMFR